MKVFSITVGLWIFYPISRLMRNRLAVAVPFRQAQELHLAKRIAREEEAKLLAKQAASNAQTTTTKRWWFF